MRKSLTALAVTATAFIAPMLMGGTAYAAEIQPVQPNLNLSSTAVADIVAKAIGGGCTTTYVGNVESTPVGTLYGINGLTITVYGGTPVTYSVAQANNTTAFERCLV
jgi:hypothetical protein